MTIAAGQVGIGTATPGYKLEVDETAATPALYLLNSNASDSFGLQLLAGNDANDYAMRIQDRTGTDLFKIQGGGDVSISDGGGLVVGHTALLATGSSSELQVIGTTTADSSMSIQNFQADALAGAYLFGAHSRGGVGSYTVLQDDDKIFSIRAQGADGTDAATVAGEIVFLVDGTPGSNDMPGRIEFKTTCDGQSSSTTRMAISNAGQVGIGTATPVFGAGLEYIKSAAGAPFDISVSSTTDGDKGQIRFRKSASATVDGTGVETADGEALGQIAALGVRNTPAYAFSASIDFEQDGSAGATAAPGKIIFKTATGSSSNREIMHIAAAGAVFIDNACAGTTNDCMSGGGLTINQGTNMTESFAIKGMSGTHCGCVLTETDTTFKIQKYTAKGGAFLHAHQSDGTTTTFMMRGIGSNTASTTKSTGAEGRVFIQGASESGTSGGSVGTDGNVAVIADWGTTRFIFDAEGTGHADVEWTTFSDERLKSNIRDLPYGLDTAMALKPRIFTRQSGYISDGKDMHLCCVKSKEVQADQPGDHQDGDVILEDKTRIQIGLIAQEAELLIPELVKAPPDKYSFYSMDYERLSVVNLSAIQELNEKVVALEAQVAALQS